MKLPRWLRSPPGPVCVGQAPNVPLAEMLCGMLQSNGIEAFYKRSGFASLGTVYGATNDFVPADIWVSPADAERARRLIAKN